MWYHLGFGATAVISLAIFFFAHARVITAGGRGWSRVSMATWYVAGLAATFFLLNLTTSVNKGFFVPTLVVALLAIHLPGHLLWRENSYL